MREGEREAREREKREERERRERGEKCGERAAYLEADDARAREGLGLVVLDDEAQVVVHVRAAGLGAGDVLRAHEAEAEAAVVPAGTWSGGGDGEREREGEKGVV